MTLFIQNDATGGGAGTLDPNQAAVDLGIIANGDTGLGLAAAVGNRQQVTYARTVGGVPPTRLDTLVNTAFTPDYALGAGPQAVPIVILAVGSNFFLNDGTSILVVGGTALPPSNSGLAGAGLNNTTDCLVLYDTTQNNNAGYCTARAGTGGTLDLQTPNPVILFHELSHAFRAVRNALLALSPTCNPSSPEEAAAITDENALRTQTATASGTPVVLRDPAIHCGAVCTGGAAGQCCIVASVASGSPLSDEVGALRAVRDQMLRRSEVGFAFFDKLHYDYYGFSPQVCTLLARHATLRPTILEGFVRPLVAALRIVEDFALDGTTALELGEVFLALHEDRDEAVMRHDLLRRAHGILKGMDIEFTHEERQLAELLEPALASPYVRWGLLQPIEFYDAALTSFLDGGGAEELGRLLFARIDEWSAQVPLQDVWASLGTGALRDELALLDQTLLRTDRARATVRHRLRRDYGTVSAIAALGDERTASKDAQ